MNMKKIALILITLFFTPLSISAQLVSSDDYTLDYQRDALKIYKDTIEMRTAVLISIVSLYIFSASL